MRNVRSVVSAGTERATVMAGRDSYLKTARNRPDLVRRVLDGVRREGVVSTYRKVRARLGEPRPLGYSSAGVVEAVGPQAGAHFRVGDRVACAGDGVAIHAERILVPIRLAARVPDGVDFDSAAFATLGAIALHAVRQARPRLGESFAVIGLGIIGQLIVQLLRANGIRVAAFDLEANPVARARGYGAEVAIAGPAEEQVRAAVEWTDESGVDAVLVAAGSRDDGPMVAAARMCRDRGRVVAVGLVPFGLPREIAYAKELELLISRSYGPGRYDREFEKRGVDYPAAYVRWTETRNLEAFLQLVAERRVDPAGLITDRFPIEEAPRAYDRLQSSAGRRPLGILIEYAGEPAAAIVAPEDEPARVEAPPPVGPLPGKVGVGFIGAGAFARSVLLPHLGRSASVTLERVVTARGLRARETQKKFGFREAGTDPDAVLKDPSIHLVCIATRHDLHAELAARALAAGKHVFVEKPPALSHAELARVEEAARSAPGSLWVGFNRRFSPMIAGIRDAVAGRGHLMMTYRVNAGALDRGHWLNDPREGGGRLVGEGCHFVDVFSFLTGDEEIRNVQAECTSRGRDGLPEDFAVQVAFADGSVGQLLYVSTGDPSPGKERLEVHGGGVSAVLDDFRRCRVWRGRRGRKVAGTGKGHAQELEAVVGSVREGKSAAIPLAVLVGVSRATLLAQEKLAEAATSSGNEVDGPPALASRATEG